MISPDALSNIMILLACLLTLSALLFEKSSFLGAWKPLTLLFFCFTASLAALAESWFGFVIWMELSSLALALLVASKDGPVARMYLYSQLTGGALLLLGGALISTPGAPAPLGPVPQAWYPLFLFALGFKAAFPGLHFWLPPTHSRAPSEVSLLLSGYAVKMGIYGLLRLVDEPSPGLLWMGVAMALYGGLQALMQRDFKRVLAYSTMSQLGFMVAALASGTPLGRDTALFYLVIHALFKGLLFLTAGSVEKLTGTRDLSLLGGLASGAPLLLLFFLVGGTSLGGLPGTGGYVAKGMLKIALKGHPGALWSLQLAGVFTALYLCKVGYYAFFRSAPEAAEAHRKLQGRRGDLPLSGVSALGILGIPLLFLGFFPEKLPFFAGTLPHLWSGGSLISALLPLGVGGMLFGLFPTLFRPEGYSLPDAENLFPPAGTLLKPTLSLLRNIHSGQLRKLLHFYFLALLGILTILSL